MSHTALKIEASKEVALGVINVDVTGIVVANEPLQHESMPPYFAHDLILSRSARLSGVFGEKAGFKHKRFYLWARVLDGPEIWPFQSTLGPRFAR
jgi:hypothetical protein